MSGRSNGRVCGRGIKLKGYSAIVDDDVHDPESKQELQGLSARQRERGEIAYVSVSLHIADPRVVVFWILQ